MNGCADVASVPTMSQMFCRTPDTDDCELQRDRREYDAVKSMGHGIPAKDNTKSNNE